MKTFAPKLYFIVVIVIAILGFKFVNKDFQRNSIFDYATIQLFVANSMQNFKVIN